MVWCSAKSAAVLLNGSWAQLGAAGLQRRLQSSSCFGSMLHWLPHLPGSAECIAQPQCCKPCTCACSSSTAPADASGTVPLLEAHCHHGAGDAPAAAPSVCCKLCALLCTREQSSTMASLFLQESCCHCGTGAAYAAAPQWDAGAGYRPGGGPHAGLLHRSSHARF